MEVSITYWGVQSHHTTATIIVIIIIIIIVFPLSSSFSNSVPSSSLSFSLYLEYWGKEKSKKSMRCKYTASSTKSVLWFNLHGEINLDPEFQSLHEVESKQWWGLNMTNLNCMFFSANMIIGRRVKIRVILNQILTRRDTQTLCFLTIFNRRSNKYKYHQKYLLDNTI